MKREIHVNRQGDSTGSSDMRTGRDMSLIT